MAGLIGGSADENLVAAYAQAWDQWESDGEDEAWDVAVRDGLSAEA